MNITYSEPCDAVTLRIFEHIFTPPLATITTNDEYEEKVFKLLELHLTTENHLNYIESTTGMTYLMAVFSTVHFNVPKRLSLCYYLLNRQCDPNIVNTYTKKTALHYLLENLHLITVPIINLIYDLLTTYSADINGIDSQGRIPMTYLSSNVHLPITPLFLALIQLLFTHNTSTYPLDHEPLSIPLSYYVFGNPRYMKEIQFPTNAYDFMDETKSQIALLPAYDSIIPPIIKNRDDIIIIDHNHQYSDEMLHEHCTDQQLLLPPSVPPTFTTLLSQFEHFEAGVMDNLPDEEWKYYKYYVFDLLQKQRQNVHSACAVESMEYPQFYSIEYSNPLYHHICLDTASLKNSTHLVIQPAPIHQLFTAIPKLDVSAIRNYPFRTASVETTKLPLHSDHATAIPSLSTTNAFANQLIPPLSMLRCLFLQDSYLFADVHNHVILFLQSHPYITPQHIELIKFLFILRKDYNHELAISHILEVLTITFKHTFTIPPAQLLKFSQHYFNPISSIITDNSAQPTTTSVPPDYYGIIPPYESDWSSTMIEKRTAPYLDLLAFCFALFEQAYYRDICRYRNPRNPCLPKETSLTLTEYTINLIIDHLLFVSSTEFTQLHPKQIIPIHTFLLYYTPLSNKYCNISLVIDEFNKVLPQIENTPYKPFTSNSDVIPIPVSLTTFTPHSLQIQILQLTGSTCGQLLDDSTIINAIFKPLNGAQASSPFQIVSHLAPNFAIVPLTNELSDKSMRSYNPDLSRNSSKRFVPRSAREYTNDYLRDPEALLLYQEFMKETKALDLFSHQDRAKYAPLPSILDGRKNNFYQVTNFTPPTHIQFSSRFQAILFDHGSSIYGSTNNCLRLLNPKDYDLSFTSINSLHFGYSEALLAKIGISQDHLTSRVNINQKLSFHYRTELISELQQATADSLYSSFSLIEFMPLSQLSFPTLIIPQANDGCAVFSTLFDIPLVFSPSNPTRISAVASSPPQISKLASKNDYRKSGLLSIIAVITLFNKHNRDYNQLVDFMNVHAEFFDLTTPTRSFINSLERIRDDYYVEENTVFVKRAQDLAERIQASTLDDEIKLHILGFFPPLTCPNHVPTEFPVNFYSLLDVNLSVESWCTRPLYTTFKYLFENTKLISNWSAFRFYSVDEFNPDEYHSIYQTLLSQCHFHKVTDLDCEQLWDYLRFQLNLNPVLVTPCLARQHLSHSLSKLKNDHQYSLLHKKNFQVIDLLLYGWLFNYGNQIEQSTFDHGACEQEYNIKATEYINNPDQLVDWVVTQYQLLPLDHFSIEQDNFITRQSSEFTPQTIQMIKKWVIFFRKATCFLSPYSIQPLNETFQLKYTQHIYLFLQLSEAYSTDLQQHYYIFSQMLLSDSFDSRASEILENLSAQLSHSIPQTYNQYTALNSAPDIHHSLKIILECHKIERIWQDTTKSYNSKDNFFSILLKFVKSTLEIPNYLPRNSSLQPELTSFAGFPTFARTGAQITNSGVHANRFTILCLQDIFQTYFKLPEQLFNEIQLPEVEIIDDDIPAISKMDFASLATQLGWAVTSTARSAFCTINPTIPAAQPLKYYNHKTQEMIFKHPASFPHIDSTLPQIFHNLLQFNPSSLRLLSSDTDFESICEQIMKDQNMAINPLFATHQYPHFESYSYYVELDRYLTPDQKCAQSGRDNGRISTIPTFHSDTTHHVYTSPTAIPIGSGYHQIVDAFPTLFFHHVLSSLSSKPSERLKTWYENIYSSYILLNAGSFLPLMQGLWGSIVYTMLSSYVPGGLPLVNTKCTSDEISGIYEPTQLIQPCNSHSSNIYTHCQHCIESNEIIFNSIFSYTKRTNPNHAPELFITLFEYFAPLLSCTTQGFLPLIRSHGINQNFKPISDVSKHVDHYIMKWRPITENTNNFSATSIPFQFWLDPFQNFNDIQSSFGYNIPPSLSSSGELTSYELATSYFFSSFCEYNQHDQAMRLQTLQFPTLLGQVASISEARQNLRQNLGSKFIQSDNSIDYFIRLPYNQAPNEESPQFPRNQIVNFLVNGILRTINASTYYAFHEIQDSVFNTSRMISFSFNSPYTPATKLLSNMTPLAQQEIDEFKFSAFRIYSNHLSARTSTHQISFKLLNLIQQLSPFLTPSDHLSLFQVLLPTVSTFFHSNRGSKPSQIPISHLIANFAKINPTIASHVEHFNPAQCSLKEIHQLFCPSYSEPIDGYTDVDIFALSCGLLPGLLPPMALSNALSHDLYGQVQSSIFQQQLLASQAAHQPLPFKFVSITMSNDTSSNNSCSSILTTLDQFIATQVSSIALPIHQTAFKQTRFFYIAEEYLKYIFESNIFTTSDSEYFARFFTNITATRKPEPSPQTHCSNSQFRSFVNRKNSKLFPLDSTFINFYKKIFLIYYVPLLSNTSSTNTTTTHNDLPAVSSLSASISFTTPFAESPLSLFSFFEGNIVSQNIGSNICNNLAFSSALQPISLSSQKSSTSADNIDTIGYYNCYKQPEKIAISLVKSAKDELSRLNQVSTILRTQMAHTLFSHQFPPHPFFIQSAIKVAKYFLDADKQDLLKERRDENESSTFYQALRGEIIQRYEFNEINSIIPMISLSQRSIDIISLFRTIIISFLDSQIPSPQQIQFLEWLLALAHSLLPSELQQISILFPPNADNYCTSNAYALGQHEYPTVFSISTLFKTVYPSFYQTKLFSFLFSTPNTPLQRKTSLCVDKSFDELCEGPPEHIYHQDILGWLICTYRQNNPFWFSQLIDFLTKGGTFTSPFPFSVSGTCFEVFKQELYKTFDKIGPQIHNFLPIFPSPEQQTEYHIWQLIKQYHLINLQPTNQFSTPVDALLHHPVIEVALFWKKLYQFALILVYNVSFLASNLSIEDSNLEFELYYNKYPKFTLPHLLDQFDILIKLYNEKSDELIQLVENTKEITFNIDGSIAKVSCNIGPSLFELEHTKLFSFLNEYRYYIDVILPSLDLYPNFSPTFDRKIFCICKTDPFNSLYRRNSTIGRIYETCPFCMYKTMICFQSSLILFGTMADTAMQEEHGQTKQYDSMHIQNETGELSAQNLKIIQQQRSAQYFIDFIADILHPIDSTSPYFNKHGTMSFPSLAPYSGSKPCVNDTIAQESKQPLTIVEQIDTSNVLHEVIVLDHTPPSYHHEPIYVSFHLPSTNTCPSFSNFSPTFTQGILWYLLTTTHLDTHDVVALLSSRNLVLYNTSTNVNHLNHTPLHHAVLLRAHPFILQALWSSLTSPNSHSTTQYHDVTYDILFSKDVFDWILLDYMRLTQSWKFAPEWTQMVLQIYQQYDFSITFSQPHSTTQ